MCVNRQILKTEILVGDWRYFLNRAISLFFYIKMYVLRIKLFKMYIWIDSARP